MSRQYLNGRDQALNGLNGNDIDSCASRNRVGPLVRRIFRTVLDIYLLAIVGYAMVQPLMSDWFLNYLQGSGIVK
jgi:hypothetical protein